VRCNYRCPLWANSGHATPLPEIESRGGVSEIPISDFEYQAAAAFRFLRHHARKPPPTNIKPGTPVADNGTGNANGRDGGNIIECKSLAAAQWRNTALTQVPNAKKPMIPLRVISSEKHLFRGATGKDSIMRTIIKAALGLGFVGAMAASAFAPAQAQGVYFSGPGVAVQVGDPEWRYRHHRGYYRDYDGPYAYAPGPRYRVRGCPWGYSVQDGVCKPYRGY